MMNSWLEIKDLTHDLGRNRVLDSLTLCLSEHQHVLVVVGPSGIGKSTLLRVLAGHLRPLRGEVTLAGKRIHGPSASRPLVFQDHNLFPWKRVLDNVTFGLKCAGMSRRERDELGRQLLVKMRMPDTADLYHAQLSGGMQQRVGLARALAVSPECILMDEPFSALDGEMRDLLCQEVLQLVAEQGTRFVIVTHNLGDAAFLADSALILRKEGQSVLLNFTPDSDARPRNAEFRASPAYRQRVAELRVALGLDGVAMQWEAA